ncbi:hypothetical protein [Aquimarina sp. RZ0]|uniref:hypothetical protein n=1 Tax=Aquimarina sp. RZ0 TaxID=2607730 RepID=UPI0011F39510|nr:hypothetical protein [Aquimarina sp. RZ0]KAA1247981.1 hypothetical protein F0000_01815 [Aquimarina sp. RZ0]
MKFKDVSRSGGYIKQAEHKQYIFKIYDKGLQYNLPEERIRIELKFTRMEKLNKIGIHTLSDLKNCATFKPLKELLQSEWKLLLLYEPPLLSDSLPLIVKNKKQFQWKDFDYWINLTKQERNRQRKKYLEYVETHTSNLHQQIANKINYKFNHLIRNDYQLTV